MEFLEALWKFIATSAPFLLFGFLIAGIIKTFVPVSWIKKTLGDSSFASVVKAALIGVPMPLCSCSVIPTAITIKKSGASNAATSAFLISTPETGVDSIMMTYGIMDLPMTIFRPVAAFLCAFVAGIGHFFFNQVEYSDDDEPSSESCCCSEKKEEPSCCATKVEEKKSCCCCCHEETKKRNVLVEVFSNSYGTIVEKIAFWMTIGLIIGAMIDYLVPTELLHHASGHVGRIIILAFGIPFYICSSASTPIAASMVMKGLTPGAALLFLLVGPATNITNLLVMQKYIGKRGIAINIASIAIVSLVLSYIVDWMYEYFEWSTNFKISGVEHVHDLSLVHHICGILFTILLLRGLYINKIKPRLQKR